MLVDYNKIPDDNTVKSMDVPIQMFDWRLWAFMGFFVILILIGSKWAGTYKYVLPSLYILVALLFIFFHTKVSVGSETLRISTPLLGDIVVYKNSINSIEIFENYANRHKMRSLVLLVLMIMLSINLAVTFQNPLMNKLYILVAFVFVYVLYATIRISSYPRIIKMHAGGKEILLYPRNEHDFLVLKDIAPVKFG